VALECKKYLPAKLSRSMFDILVSQIVIHKRKTFERKYHQLTNQMQYRFIDIFLY